MTCLLLISVAFAVVGVVGPAGSTSGPPPSHASIVLHLQTPADRSFPMFDPVNEARWVPGWRPALLGEARVAAGLVFTTEDDHGRTAWLLDRYDVRACELRYVVARPTTLTTIDIAVVADGPRASIATVTYTRTALEPAAAGAVEEFIRHFSLEAPHWESAINAALASGSGR
ncbi:MAG TPA: hypothetical protein VFE70_06435 [Candidatus Elarobacter sp.]|nr:hypothetical protein [Candidatus Elarobacter sp.]